MRILLLTNLVYAFVLPVIDVFVGAYVMRNSQDVKLVVIYQLAVYTGIPFTFLINGFLLQRISIKRLYSAGMLLSGISMAVMMSLGHLSLTGVCVAGLLMGMSFGLFWANRDFLALSTTDDNTRNYYYGVETFFYTNTYVIVPMIIGLFIEATGERGWFGGDRNTAYQIVTGCVFLLTIAASIVVHRGNFRESAQFRIHFLPLPLALESDATVGDSEGARARVHRHSSRHARDETRRTRGSPRHAASRRRNPVRVSAVRYRPNRQAFCTAY